MFQQIGRELEALRQRLRLLWRDEDKEEDEALWSSPVFTALSGRQIEAILAIVKGEIKQTKEQYGHLIRREDVFKEKCFFLLVFQKMGGICLLSKRTSFEEVQRIIYTKIEADFKEELECYFNEWDGKGSRLWYLCHLQSVTNTLLHAIWSGEITQL